MCCFARDFASSVVLAPSSQDDLPTAEEAICSQRSWRSLEPSPKAPHTKPLILPNEDNLVPTGPV